MDAGPARHAGYRVQCRSRRRARFQKLSIKARREIVTLGLPQAEDLDPNEITGRHLSPKAFYQAMQDPDAVVLDARNVYESELGHFRNALCPEVEHFRDFPEWIRRHRKQLEGKRILTYYAGGIRCEKFSGFLLQEGFQEVHQLQGGIVNYGGDPETRGRDFQGNCYVFDERIAVPVNHVNPTIISRCAHCAQPCDRYRNCALASCNAQFFCCLNCEDSLGRTCSSACHDRVVTEAASPVERIGRERNSGVQSILPEATGTLWLGLAPGFTAHPRRSLRPLLARPIPPGIRFTPITTPITIFVP